MPRSLRFPTQLLENMEGNPGWKDSEGEKSFQEARSVGFTPAKRQDDTKDAQCVKLIILIMEALSLCQTLC